MLVSEQALLVREDIQKWINTAHWQLVKKWGALCLHQRGELRWFAPSLAVSVSWMPPLSTPSGPFDGISRNFLFLFFFLFKKSFSLLFNWEEPIFNWFLFLTYRNQTELSDSKSGTDLLDIILAKVQSFSFICLFFVQAFYFFLVK